MGASPVGSLLGGEANLLLRVVNTFPDGRMTIVLNNCPRFRIGIYVCTMHVYRNVVASSGLTLDEGQINPF